MSRLVALAALVSLVAPLHSASPLPKVPAGFKVELVLEAPAIEAPTALCVAPNGDVYFAEDPMDMGGPPTKNLDRIWLLRGGDPKKKVLFADKMWAVMGMELVGNKLYVVHAPHVTVFTLDAQGKAKERKELFDDLGPKVAGLPSFNDHIPSGIRMGMDGWLYVSIGDKGIPKMTRKEKDRGSVEVAEGRWRHRKEGHHISLEGGGVIRFRPDGSGLEVFASGTRNHLDVPLDEHDRIFVRDNTDDGRGWNTRLMYLPPGGYMGYPWAYKRRPKETLPMIHDFGGGSPCGGWVYLDDGLPQTYRGRIFHCEWGQGKVWAVKVAPDGAGFKYVDQVAFMDPAGVKDFRPFCIRPTADGRGFYVTDWGYSGWLNPKKAGRLWKVTYTGDDVKPAPRGKATDSVEQLVESLGHPAHSERLRAQRELKARGAEAVPLLEKCLNDAERAWRARAGAMWVLADVAPEKALDWMARGGVWKVGKDFKIEVYRFLADERLQQLAKKHRMAKNSWLGNVYEGVLNGWFQEDDPAVQLFAARALEVSLYGNGTATFWLDVIGHVDEARLRKMEADPFVRAACVRILRKYADWAEWKQIPEEALKGWKKEKPAALEAQHAHWEMVWEALAEKYTLPAVAMLKAALDFPDAEMRRRALETLARNYKDRKPYPGTWWGTQPAGHAPPPRVVAWEGTPLVRDAILTALADRDAGVRKAALNALVTMNDPATLEPLVRQFGKEKDGAARADIVRAVAGLQAPKAGDFLLTILKDGKSPEALRLEAIAGLEKSKTPAAVEGIARAAAAGEPVAVQVRALEALGAMRTGPAKAVAAASIKSPEPAVRRAAVTTLARLGDAGAAGLLLPLLRDPEASVRTAAIQALGTLKARAAVPALVQAAGGDATQFEAISALAKMPDKRALSAYLTGLGSKNADLRAACRQAITAIREDVVPNLEQLVKKNEVRSDLLPELRSIYQSFAPVTDWNLIGPFPDNGKAHPPEKEVKLDAAYPGAGKEVKWRRHQKGDPRLHGKVNLQALFTPHDGVVAYGYAEIESDSDRDAQLLIGSDDTLVIWLNGKKVFEFPGNRGWQYDQDRVNVRLHKGKNQLLVRCGNNSGPWEFSVAVSGNADRYAFLKGGAKKYDLNAFRDYARKTSGDAARGRRLFMDLKGLACVKCHAVNGQGGQVGPDLAGIGLKYKRDDLMTSVLEPSKVIAQGYETIIVTTTKGKTLTGVFKGETGAAVNLTDAEGNPHRVPKKDIEEREFSPVSSMPNGLSDGMTLQDFADLIAFLEAQKEEKAVPKK